LLLQYGNDRYGDRNFNTKIRAGTFCIYDSVLVPAAGQLLPFLALLYAEVRIVNLECTGVIPLQFAVTFKCNVRYFRSVTWQSPLFVNPVPNRARYCVMPVIPLNMEVTDPTD